MKTIIKIFQSRDSMKRAFKKDSKMFQCLGVLTQEYIQEKTLETKYGTIRYYCEDTLDKMRGYSIDMAIIDESFEDVDKWKNECLAPSLYDRKGEIV